MSDDDGNVATGILTKGGGDVVHRSRNTTSGGVGSASVTNQQQLALPANLFADLSADEARAIAIIQLEFAHDISARSARAYGEILNLLTPSSAKKQST